MTPKRSFRVYFTAHPDGRLTGILLRTWDWFFDRPSPAAYGVSEEDVLAQLEAELHGMVATKEDALERYLWDDAFEVRTITVEVHPQTTVKKRVVIGKRRIPIRLSYLWSKLREGGFRVMLPRFSHWFIVEELASAPEVLRQMVTTALLGENPRSLYDFRMEGEEYVRAWSPRLAQAHERGLAGRKGHSAPRKEERPTLEAVAEELVDRAVRQKLPPVVGESAELDAAMRLVDRAAPASILLVGGAGVGKTTWVYRLARRFAAWRREPGRRRVPRLYSTSGDRILSGMKYLGMWQARCLKLVEELSHEGDFLHVGALLPLLRPQPDGASIADLFLPALRAGEVSLIGECTEEELEVAQRRAATVVSCFQVVRLREMEAAAVPGLLAEYEVRRDLKVRLHPAGKKRLVQHLAMFRRDVRFPGKALRFLDWLAQEGQAGAGPSAASATKGGAKGSAGEARLLYPRDVSAAYARYSGLPMELIADEVPAGAEAIAKGLRQRVVGQDAACAVAARVLARFKAGMNDPERPSGTLLFVGPTGVGKTELAKQLARTMFGDEGRMIRLDMSEYMLPGASARLLATGPGVVSLAQRVRQEPLSLVLLDELEKAHREVFDLLLGVLGEGRLSDDEGRLVDFRMTLIVMTSNLGVSDRAAVGFGGGGERGGGEGREAEAQGGGRGVVPAAVREHFRPELFNRIDHVVTFSALDRDSVLRIVDLELNQAQARTGLVRRGLRLRATEEARARLSELGFDPRRGARPLKRVIEEQVITPIAARMAADPGYREREVPIRVESGQLVVG
ncbi:AAA family ATPase [Chondromyces apiculatus]|uniref:ATP-dependent Clp protease ATP-binding subunit ClpA n=1 Tax=Chondromyces apiculatus DSM 436 TaxID=1192034 RepID=A0A017TE77_9BACT|nr:AAA family ATPase [Chondromyces apiculatus]EYF07120.1 ATP-dependent Clp protease ATP-binding subunit ClpA [Chondromyces apiculatus DSM 436]